MPKTRTTHPAKDLPLVVVELGSNSVRAMAAERIGRDLLHVLAYEESNKHACVERGLITDAYDAGYMINELLRLLANRLNVEALSSAFTLIGGRDMQIAEVKAKRDLIHKRPITQEIRDNLKQECILKIEKHNPGVSVYDIIPSYFILDGVEQEQEPTDNDMAAEIEAHYTVFVGHSIGKSKLQDSFENAKTHIEHSFVRPDAVLSAISAENSDMLAAGCAMVDFGAQTTTVTIYKQSEYLYNKVIPLGGQHITRFIEQQGIPFAYAEQIKCQYGWAASRLVDKDHIMALPSSISGQDSMRMTFRELADMIEMKLNEIVQGIQTALNPYMSRIETVYVTGGGSMLQGLVPYLQERLGIPVTFGSHAYLLDRQTDDEFCKPQYASLIGGLILGADWRAEHPDESIPDKKSFIERVKSGTKQTILDLFTDNTDNPK